MREVRSSPASQATTLPSQPERCCICLMNVKDATKAGKCGHEFCFECIGVWANQSRRCPLCSAPMDDVLEHDLDSVTGPTKFHLPPLPSPSRRRQSPTPTTKLAYQAHVQDQSALDAALSRRKRIYAEDQWTLHVPTNKWTRYTDVTPHDFRSPAEVGNGESSSAGAEAESDTARRARAFLTRELQLFPVDAAAATTQLIRLFKVADLRSTIAGNVLHDLIGREGARVLHELYSFLRSPFELEAWDEIEQYGGGDGLRGRTVSRSPSRGARSRSAESRSRSRSWSRSRSRSWSRGSSRSPSRDRRRRGDQFVPAPENGERRWDRSDSWVDPEFAKPRRRRRGGRREREREARREAAKAREAEPGPHINPALVGGPSPQISIKGSAERRQSLEERLARLKAQQPTPAPAPAPAPVVEEDKAAQLRERLIAERKRKILREQLLARKRAKTEAKTENSEATLTPQNGQAEHAVSVTQPTSATTEVA